MSQNDDSLFRVVYFSRNCIQGGEQDLLVEINGILATAQRNNRAADVSGVLIFNGGVFGQLLEGPMDAVEDIFDTIQSDPRHFDVTVLEAEPVSERLFKDWSMGFVGSDPRLETLFGDFNAAAAFDANGLDRDKLLDTLCALAIQNEASELAA